MQARIDNNQRIYKHPGRFLLRVLKGFHANQGILLSGAVAYYTLLSIIPLFTLLLLALSHVVDETQLLATLAHYLDLVVPGKSQAVMEQIKAFLADRHVFGWVMVGALLFFSSMAFSILENALSVIFFHRVAIHRRHFLISALLPYLFILLMGLGFLVITIISGVLQAGGSTTIALLGWQWTLGGLAGPLLYLLGLGSQILMLTSLYMVMPVGHPSLRHALIGGITAGLLWEIIRHGLIWYFANLSLVNVIYGSLATAIVALLSLEIAAMILLLGAQVIAEYERVSKGEAGDAGGKMHT